LAGFTEPLLGQSEERIDGDEALERPKRCDTRVRSPHRLAQVRGSGGERSWDDRPIALDSGVLDVFHLNDLAGKRLTHAWAPFEVDV
jgi:hypothetical protein